MKYAQKECYDCLGVFPGNEVRRVRFTQYGGESETRGNPDSTRIHLRTREAFLCRSCSAKRKRKSLLKWTAILAAATAVIVYLGVSQSGRSEREQDSSSAVTKVASVEVNPDSHSKNALPPEASTPQIAVEPENDVKKSVFFDFEAETSSDAQCNVKINGNPIIDGSCTVEARTDRAVIFSDNDGCTIDIIGHGSSVKAELTAYKNICPLLDEGAEPATTMLLGSVSRRGDCWSNSEATICARP